MRLRKNISILNSKVMLSLSHLEEDLTNNIPEEEEDEIELLRFSMLFSDDTNNYLDDETARILRETESPESQENKEIEQPSSSLSSPLARLCVTQNNSPASVRDSEDQMDDYVPPDYNLDTNISQHISCSISTDVEMTKFMTKEPPMKEDCFKNHMKQYEENTEKAKNPVYTHRRHSVLVDQGFLKYELEVPNNPEFPVNGSQLMEYDLANSGSSYRFA